MDLSRAVQRRATPVALLCLFALLTVLIAPLAPASATPGNHDQDCHGIPNQVDGSLTVSMTDLSPSTPLLPGDSVEATARWDSTATTPGGSVLICIEVDGAPIYSRSIVPPLDGDDGVPDGRATYSITFTVGLATSDVPALPGKAVCPKSKGDRDASSEHQRCGTEGVRWVSHSGRAPGRDVDRQDRQR